MVYILYYNYSYTKFLLGAFADNPEVKLVEVPRERFPLNAFYRLFAKLNVDLFAPVSFNIKVRKVLHAIKKDDVLLLFDYLKYPNVRFLLKRTKAAKIHVWIWNTIGENEVKLFKCLHDERLAYHTFDSCEAERYGIAFHEQFYREKTVGDEKEMKYDFFFAGLNKGRLPYLEALSKKLRSYGYATLFVVSDATAEKDLYPNVHILRKEIPYAEILDWVAQSRVIVDIVKENQAGMTLRVLEGIFLKKKVLSNNDKILDSTMFRPENFFVMKGLGLNKESLDQFMASVYQPYDEAFRRKLRIETWLDNICR